jgi:hypothetical protein
MALQLYQVDPKSYLLDFKSLHPNASEYEENDPLAVSMTGSFSGSITGKFSGTIHRSEILS